MLIPATMELESHAQRDIEREIGKLISFKMQHYVRRLRLWHIAETNEEKLCLEHISRHKAVAEIR